MKIKEHRILIPQLFSAQNEIIGDSDPSNLPEEKSLAYATNLLNYMVTMNRFIKKLDEMKAEREAKEAKNKSFFWNWFGWKK